MRAGSLLAVLSALASACAAPAPRIPFQDTNWHAAVVGADWTVNKSFVEDISAVGIDMVFDEPDTGGWAYEFGVRYAWGDGDGETTRFDPDTPTFPMNQDDLTLVVPSEREIQFYEFSFGVRQTYRPDSRFQPYFGVGGTFIQSRSEEFFVQPAFPGDPGNNGFTPFPNDTPIRDHERSEIYPGIYMRGGFVWNLLKDQLAEDYEFPIGFDVRGMLSVDYSYIEVAFSFGYGK